MKKMLLVFLALPLIGCATVKEAPKQKKLHPFFAIKGQTITVTPGADYICLPVEEFNTLTR